MCKLQFNCLGKTLGNVCIAVVSGLLFLGLGATTAVAGPANDNFINATGINGLAGTISGSNVGATKQPGEPVAANTGGGKSIWYQWTAPFTGTMDFNTEGSDFDTVLGIYTGNNVTNLTLVAQNDDVAFPNDLTSDTKFPVTQGVVYEILVDGHEGDSGTVTLNWSPTGDFSAGNIGFAAPGTDESAGFPLYICAQSDALPQSPIIALDMEYIGPRVRVMRTNGFAGKIAMNYVITNTTYQDTLITNFFGTNVFSVNLSTNAGQGSNFTLILTNVSGFSANFSFTGVLGTSNLLDTNVVANNLLGNYVNGRIVQCEYDSGFVQDRTNINGKQFGNLSTVSLGTNLTIPPILPLTGLGTNTNTDGTLTVLITNTYFFTTLTNVIVPSARPNVDYVPTAGTVTMIDYQMGADIPYDLPEQGFGAVANPDPSTLRNHLLVVQLSNAALDPSESTNALSQPVITVSNAFVQIVNDSVFLNPQGTSTFQGTYSYLLGGGYTQPCPALPTNSIANFVQSVYHVNEALGTNNTRLARVFLMRTGTNFTSSLSVRVTADFNGRQLNGVNIGEVNNFALQPGSDYATPTNSIPNSRQIPHFSVVDQTVTWGANDGGLKELDVVITNDPAVQFNEDILLQMSAPSGGAIGLMGACTIVIQFNNEPAGSVDRDHNPNNVAFTNPPLNPAPGAGGDENTVYAAAIQPADNKTVFGGDFLAYNTVPRNRIARMNADGSLDQAFLANNNSGANNTVGAIGLQPDGKIVIGGAFTSFNATNRFYVARLNTDGSLDLTFNTGIGANNNVWAVAVYPATDPVNSGKVLIGGDFTFVNATNRSHIARLNSDGSLDLTFDPGVGPNDTVNAITIEGSGGILVGGNFTTIDNANFSSIARLNSDGSLDQTFNPGLGADGNVYALVEQPDGKIVVGGAFDTINLTPRNSIARLFNDGSMDTTFDPGTGANDEVDSLALQQDGNILIGGHFTSYNGTRRIGAARLLANGSLDTSFLDTAYNQFAGLINTVNNEVVQPRNFLKTIAIQSDGNVIIGGRFSQLGGGVDYVNYTTINDTTSLTNGLFARDAISPRFNIARLIGGATPGPGNIGLNAPSFSVDKANENFYVTLVRANGELGPATVTLQTDPLHNGTGDAVAGADFQQAVDNPVWNTSWDTGTWNFSDDFSGLDNQPTNVLGGIGGFITDSFVSIFSNPASSGNLQLGLQLTQPTGLLGLGGAISTLAVGVAEPIPTGVALGTAAAPLTIIDNSVPAGTLVFSTPQFFVNENGTNALITVIRTNGSTGTISVKFQTIPGTGPNGALPGPTNDYLAVTGTLNFNSGQTNQTFTVPIVNNFFVRPDRSLTLSLFNPTGGAQIGGTSNAVLTIINDNFLNGQLSFTSTNYSAHENAGTATISVIRLGGSEGIETVMFQTANGSASSNQNYFATNGVLTWNSGDTSPKTFTVPVLNSGVVNSNTTVNLILTNATVNGSPAQNIIQPPLDAASSVTNDTSTLTIINDDFFGSPTLSAPNYTVDENAGFAVITVNRLNGSSQTITVDFATSDGTARNGFDYEGTNGTLTFTNGQFSESFTVPIINNSQQTNDGTFFNITLSNPQPNSSPVGGVVLGNPSAAPVTIVANQTEVQPPGSPDTLFNGGFNDTVYSLALQSDGSIVAGGDFTEADGVARNRIARLTSVGALDEKFSSGSGGANASVRAVSIQSDGEILLGGLFTQVNGVNQNYITRLNFDGTLDSTFNQAGQGADNPVYAITEATSPNSSGKIIIGGSFASINGIPYRSIAQLNSDGTVDTTFNTAGANGTVYAVAAYSLNDALNGGKILIGGDFTAVNGTNVAHIARLNADGSLDTTFNSALIGSGPSDSVRAIAIQVDGNVVIGGLFTSVNGAPLNFIARLDSSGQVDPSFNAGVGADDAVTTLAIQQDLKIVVGGAFQHFNGITRNRLTRLNSDGSVDAGINFGTGADGFVNTLAIQPNAELVLGGGFTHFNGISTPYIARLYGGTETGPGVVQFSAPNYAVDEAQGTTNITINVVRLGGTGFNGPNQPEVPINVVFSTSDGTAIAGTDYEGVTTNLTFNVGETLQTVTIPILSDPTNMGQLTFNLSLTTNDVSSDPAILGNQSLATVSIVGANSTVSFSNATYTVSKNVNGGNAVIFVQRNDSTVGIASIDVETTLTGTAQPGLDFTPITNTLVFQSGVSNLSVSIPILNNQLPEGNRTVGLALVNPTNTTLDPTLPTTATLTIVDNVIAPGSLEFSQSGYTNFETDGQAVITVLRVGGSSQTVTVNYSTSDGSAVAGSNYVATSGALTFIDGQTVKSFSVPLINNTNQSSTVVANLTLSQPGGGASLLPPTTVPLTILNANQDVSFALAGYFVDEKGGSVQITVNRVGNTNTTDLVNYATVDGTATSNVNYRATSGTLTFLPGQTSQNFLVPIIYDPEITGNLVFFISLSKTSNNSPVQIVNPGTTTVTVEDDDSGFELASPTNAIVKGDTSAIISVLRLGNTAGQESVAFATTGGTANAGVEYTPTNGVLNFISGQVSNSFAIPIHNDNQIDGDQTVNFALLNPTGGAQLLTPSNGVLTIIDTESGFSFSSGAFSVNENGVAATINVVRTGVTNTPASVNFATADGTAHAPSQYTATSGTLNFAAGETTASFPVQIIDNNVTGGSETVLLSLSNPSADTLLVPPVAATLTILNNDGSLIVPDGAAVLNPASGVINPNTNVTVLLSLLNVAGSDATNLTATLLATNGVSNITIGTNSYGTLVLNGPSKFMPFSFSVNGTNGQSVSAVLQLHFDKTNASTVSYSFSLGTVTNIFSNTNLITINDAGADNSATAATPYPSTIAISSLGGVVSKVTTTVSNLTHGSIADVGILLVGPTGQQKELLMEDTGGSKHSVNNVTYTFDSTSANGMTTNQPASGTYRPSPLLTVEPFPNATNINGGTTNITIPPPQPYGTNLGDFIGTNPNGTWSLYVDDNVFLDAGTINKGWNLAITTLNVVAANVDLVAGVTASPNPVVESNTLTYTISVTNAGPSPATSVGVTNILPAGVTNVTASASAPSGVLTTLATNNDVITCTFSGLATNAVGTVTISVVPTASDLGFITDSVFVSSAEIEDNPADNAVSVVTSVVTPTADLAIGVVDNPNIVAIGGNVTYTVSLTNNGPAKATSVEVSNTAPAGVSLISDTAVGGLTSGAGFVDFNVGDLAVGQATNFNVVVKMSLGGTVTNLFAVSSSVPDPLKGNNFGSVKTIVGISGPVLSVPTLSGRSLTFTLPSNFSLQSTGSLTPPAWQNVTNNVIFITGGSQVTVTIGSGTQFFRLISQ